MEFDAMFSAIKRGEIGMAHLMIKQGFQLWQAGVVV